MLSFLTYTVWEWESVFLSSVEGGKIQWDEERGPGARRWGVVKERHWKHQEEQYGEGNSKKHNSSGSKKDTKR